MAIKQDAIAKKKPAKVQEQAQDEQRTLTAAEILADEEAEKARHQRNEQTRRTKNKRTGLSQIACWVPDDVYNDLQRLASYRAGRDQKTTMQSTIAEALRMYLQAYKKELETWDSVKLPNE